MHALVDIQLVVGPRRTGAVHRSLFDAQILLGAEAGGAAGAPGAAEQRHQQQ